MELASKEIAYVHAERPSKPEYVQGGTVPNTALNPAHVAAADLRDVGKCLLGKALLFAESTDSRSEPFKGGMLGGLASLAWHDTNAGLSHPFGPRPMEYNKPFSP